MSREMDDLAGAAAKEGSFGVFLAAARSASMIELLQGAGPFTVFAPTDKAFAKFPRSTLARLMKPAHRELLVKVVGYHLALGAVRSRALAGKRFRAKTHAGSDLRIDGVGDAILVNSAPIVLPDLVASNGVLHGIDHVLWPKPAQTQTMSAAGG